MSDVWKKTVEQLPPAIGNLARGMRLERVCEGKLYLTTRNEASRNLARKLSCAIAGVVGRPVGVVIKQQLHGVHYSAFSDEHSC